MNIDENESGGVTVVLGADDQLDDVPESHASLISPQIREVFLDPNGYLRETARQCEFPEMRAWLMEAVESGEWRLELDRHIYDAEVSFAGFYWPGTNWPARISLPEEELPEWLWGTMRAYYSLIGELDTNGFGVAGGFWPANQLTLLSGYFRNGESKNLDPETAVVWGGSPCGDLMLFTTDGEAGWYEHGEHYFEPIGSEEEAINWIFARLRRGEAPYPDL